jgi:hypothetical protein
MECGLEVNKLLVYKPGQAIVGIDSKETTYLIINYFSNNLSLVLVTKKHNKVIDLDVDSCKLHLLIDIT